jgi:hypothetical protein
MAKINDFFETFSKNSFLANIFVCVHFVSNESLHVLNQQKFRIF